MFKKIIDILIGEEPKPKSEIKIEKEQEVKIVTKLDEMINTIKTKKGTVLDHLDNISYYVLYAQFSVILYKYDKKKEHIKHILFTINDVGCNSYQTNTITKPIQEEIEHNMNDEWIIKKVRNYNNEVMQVLSDAKPITESDYKYYLAILADAYKDHIIKVGEQ